MTDANTDQNETTVDEATEVTEEPQVQAQQPAAPTIGTFNLIFGGHDWQIQTNMGRHVLVGVLRDVINKLEAPVAQSVVQPAAPAAQPAEEAQPTPEEKKDA